MAKTHSAHEPLLLNHADVKNPPRFAPSAFVKWVLNIAMWLLFIFWVAIIFASPSESAEKFTRNWTRAASGSIYGFSGSAFALPHPVFI